MNDRKTKMKADNIDKIVGERLKKRRQKLKWSQSTLADKLEMSFQQIQKYESGRNKIALSTLVRAAKEMGVKLAIFTRGLENEI